MTPTPDQLRAAQAKVPFAFGLAPPSGAAGGLVHDWQRCSACARLRFEALERATAERAQTIPATATQP